MSFSFLARFGISIVAFSLGPGPAAFPNGGFFLTSFVTVLVILAPPKRPYWTLCSWKSHEATPSLSVVALRHFGMGSLSKVKPTEAAGTGLPADVTLT
ncbi:hypothetical protein E6H36_11360 [Candidatus Bathyarchaeota archaeon]|nr:MAG: hypothetical protein E6H36_11360 [Candidatus Bathyarchaeota archaeon]TMI32325.1 MAG: hypothetical protein E6H29_02425 [Candidatus Bathyarchaeota archaeon]